MNLDAIFKAYDVRGKVGTELTPEVAKNIGRAFADWLPDDGDVAVGRDMRPDSAELAAALIDGLRLQGRNVIDIGEVTSDMIYFAAGHLELAGGVMITASHNPGEYNGIKFCGKEARGIGQDTGLFDIRDIAKTGSFKKSASRGSHQQKDITEDWITHVLSFIDTDKLTELPIVVDAGNGMAGKIFPELEPYVPWDVTELYFELDGTFPNHEANPIKFETLADAINIIKKKRLYGGIAFDGDGDRAFLIDETGSVLSGGVIVSLLSEYFLKKYPGSNITYNVCTTRAAVDTIQKNGGTPVRTKVGHSYIKQVMREKDAPFGGEASGHFYFRDNWYADSGLIAAVIALYVATLSGKKLSVIRKQYTTYVSIPETNFVIEDKEATLKAIETSFAGKKIDYLDGLTVDLGNGAWFNVRTSNTEPVIRLNAEAKTRNELDAIVAKVTKTITT